MRKLKESGFIMVIRNESAYAKELIGRIILPKLRGCFEKASEKHRNNFFIAFSEESPEKSPIGIGFHTYEKPNAGGETRMGIFVLPEYRRHGVASALLDEMLKTIPVVEGVISTDAIYEGEEHEAAMEFCRAEGFKPWYSMYDMEYDGGRMDEWLDETGANEKLKRTTLEIVPYADEYYERLVRVKSLAWATLAKRFGFTMDEPNAAQRRSWLDSAANTYVCLADGEPVSMCCRDDGCNLHGLFVHPDFQHMGIGRAMIAHGINASKNEGYQRVSLCVITENPAIRLYGAIGFKAVATRHYFKR